MVKDNIKKAAVLGAGTMGPGIALTYAIAGVGVNLYTRSERTLGNAKMAIKAAVEVFVEEGLIKPGQVSSVYERIFYTNDLARALKDVDLMLETIAENAEIKREFYLQVDGLLDEGVMFASNTSALNIFELVPERRQKDAVIQHWFMPPHIIPLVEIVRGPQTSEEIMQRSEEFIKRIGKVPIRMERYTRGFIVNKIQGAIAREMMFLIDEGFSTPQDIDIAVKASIMPRAALMGLFQTKDFNGLDINSSAVVSPKLKALLDAGNYGVKTGKGWYDYSGRKPEELLKKRDKELIKILKTTGEYIYKQI